MNKYHQEILNQVKQSSPQDKSNFNLAKYLGTNHLVYRVRLPQLQKISKEWVKNHKEESFDQVVKTVDSLFKGQSIEEKMIASFLWEFFPKSGQKLDLKKLDEWLDYLTGWAEVDTLGTGLFGAEELVENWQEWQRWIIRWSKDKNVNKRRFSLVVLIIPIRDSYNIELVDQAFENIEQLKGEKDILITKAISWLLRGLIKKHKDKVEKYLEENPDSLPKIALRETTKKLLTGKK